jgi:perosamine synthetase
VKEISRLVAPIGGTMTLKDCLIAVRYLVAGARLARGRAVREYEREFERLLGVAHAYAFGSGRVGLYGILSAMGIGKGDEVLVQVPTHVVVPNAIRYSGAKPVFVDSRADNFNMDLAHAEDLVTARTKVLLLQHTFGIPIDLDAALDLAGRHGLKVIEDCAHALGARYDGRHVGSFGDAAFFSTEEKTISSAMGGMVVTSDDGLADRIEQFQASCSDPSSILAARYLLKLLVFHVITQPPVHRYTRPLYKLLRSRIIAPGATSEEEARGERPRGYERRLSNAQAAVALSQLRGLDAHLSHRETVSSAYAQRLSAHGLAIPRPPAKASPAFVRYPLWVPDKPGVTRAVARHAILGQWLSEPVDGAAAPGDRDYQPGSCPSAENIVAHLVSLPTHLRVRPVDVERIVTALAGVTGAEPDSRQPGLPTPGRRASAHERLG